MTLEEDDKLYKNIEFFNTFNVNNYALKIYKVIDKKNIDFFHPLISFSSVRGDYITLKQFENIDCFRPSNIDIHLFLHNHNLY